MKLYTIGFTKKTAESFFTLLQNNGIQQIVDIRLHPGGQLSGFAKQEDLRFFLRRLANCEYSHVPILAPSQQLLSDYHTDHNWERFAAHFESLMSERKIPGALDRSLFETRVCCLLCSEASPERCHRRLVAERLASHWSTVEVIHL